MTDLKKQKPIRAGVIGWPIDHSLSPRLHGFWLDQYGIDGTYEAMAVEPENFEAALRALPAQGFAGTNITVPHKEAALEIVDTLDPVAERIGAVNTIFVKSDGTLHGTNTDAFGFMENLKAGAPEWDPKAGSVVVLGAGGAARAVVAALIDAGVPEVRLINRTIARAQALSLSVGGPVSVYGWSHAADVLVGATLLVNTTTLGMQGQPPLELDLSGLAEGAIVTDIVYTPLITPLLQKAQQAGYKIVDGLGMLLHQAAPGFKGWFGKEPLVDEALRAHVLAEIEDRNG